MYNAERVLRNKPPILATDFDFTPPEVYSGPRSTRNTKVFLLPKSVSGNYGRITIYYDRINLNTLTGITVIKGSNTRIYQVIGQLNEETGMNMSSADLVDDPLAVSGSTTITASTGSYLFTGNTTISYTP